MHDILREISENIRLSRSSKRAKKAGMTETLKERELETSSSPITADLEALQGREPKRALTLSIVPGLGQFYNGERVKGLLFFTVGLANVLLLALLFCTEPLLNSLIQIGSLINADSKINVKHALEIVQAGRGVTLVYLSLILSFAAFVARDAYDRAVEKRRGIVIPRFKFTMPEATSGSYLVHFSIICALVLMVMFVITPPKPQEQITDILLMQEEEPPPPQKAPEPPKPKQEPKREEPKKVEKKPPTPPKPTPVAVAVKTDQPVADPVVQSDEPAPPVTPTETGSANGSPTGTGAPDSGGGGNGNDVDFGSYLAEVRERIKKNWFPPRGAESLSFTLKFNLLKDGSLDGNIKLVKSSGIAAADDAGKTAIKNAAPFPPLPAGSEPPVTIKFTFDYNVFNGKL